MVLAGAAFAAVLVYFVTRTGPWIECKAFGITAVMALAFAFVGASALARGRLTVIGLLAAAAVSGGVLYGNALAYRNAMVASAERLQDLQKIGEDFAGRGPTLYPALDEQAEYFLRRAQGIGLVHPIFGLGIRPGVEFDGQLFSVNLDDYDREYLERFSLIVARRDPQQSRPPSNWKRVRSTRYHEVWQRVRSDNVILRHFPISGEGPGPGLCRRVRASASETGPKARVAWVQAPDRLLLDPTSASHTPTWPVGPNFLVTVGPGQVDGQIEVERPGRYTGWLAGNFGRGIEVSINGRRIGEVAYRPNYPDAWEYVGDIDLAPGTHDVKLTRGGGTLRPGNGDFVQRTLGPLVLVRHDDGGGKVRVASARRAAEVCRSGEPLDWIEILRG
jgi:hypothetical protein